VSVVLERAIIGGVKISIKSALFSCFLVVTLQYILFVDRGGFLKIKKFHISPSPPADLRCKFEGHLDIDRENNIERMYF